MGFHMADIREKRPTRRRAVAVGELQAGPEAFPMIAARTLPKGDALAMAEVAGLQGAKLASALMPLCHPLPLDLVRVLCETVADRQAVRVYCECAAEARTGVEMEALAGVNAALLTLYDLCKPVEPALVIGPVRLLFKEGGKRGLWLNPDGLTQAEQERFRPRGLPGLDGARCAVITLSDRVSAGSAEDRSGPVLAQALAALGGDIAEVEVLPDGIEPLCGRLRELAEDGIKLCVCTGGTGLGPRDLTPEALAQVEGRTIPGLSEMLRSQGSRHTAMAWLGRGGAVQVGGMLVIALPGSERAVRQGFDILAPVLAHALAMINGGGHE